MPMRVTRGGWQRATPVQSPAGQQPWWSPASEILRFQTILDDYIVGGKIADLIFDFGDDMYGRRGPMDLRNGALVVGDVIHISFGSQRFMTLNIGLL